MRCFNTLYRRVTHKGHWYGVHNCPPVGLGLIIMPRTPFPQNEVIGI